VQVQVQQLFWWVLGNKPRILIDRPTQVSFCDALGEA
jgi:hypothetical protein